MRLSPRLLVPVLGAFAVTGGLLGVMWWQLQGAAVSGNGLRATMSAASEPTADEPVFGSDAGSVTLQALRDGDLLALQGDWKAAEEQYRSAVSQGGLTALKKLATAQLQRRDYKAVRATMERMSDQGAQPEEIMLLSAMLSLREGQLGNAKQTLTDAPDSPHKHYGLALVSIAEGTHDVAEQEVDAVIAGWDPLLRAHARKLKTAYEQYRTFPNSPEIHLVTLLSKALAETQQCELSLPLLTQVIAQRDDYRDAWIVQGYCQLTTERADAALDSLQKAYNLDPEKPEIQYFLARAHAAANDHGNAVTFAQFALRNGFQPEREVRSFLAQEAELAGMPQVAMEQLTLLMQDPQADLRTFAKLTSLLTAAQRQDDALVTAQAAADRFPQDGRAHELLGSALEALSRTPEAVAAYQRALQIQPNLQHAQARLTVLQNQ